MSTIGLLTLNQVLTITLGTIDLFQVGIKIYLMGIAYSNINLRLSSYKTPRENLEYTVHLEYTAPRYTVHPEYTVHHCECAQHPKT